MLSNELCTCCPPLLCVRRCCVSAAAVCPPLLCVMHMLFTANIPPLACTRFLSPQHAPRSTDNRAKLRAYTSCAHVHPRRHKPLRTLRSRTGASPATFPCTGLSEWVPAHVHAPQGISLCKQQSSMRVAYLYNALACMSAELGNTREARFWFR